MEKYLEVKKKARRIVYQAKCKAQWKRFGNIMQRDDQKCKKLKFKSSKMTMKTNEDLIRR